MWSGQDNFDMETLLFFLAGVIPMVIRTCDKKIQIKYKNLAWALLLTTAMAFIGGCDIARQFDDNPWVIVPIGLLWALAVFSFDYFLMWSDDVALFFKIIRLPVGLANVFITTVSLLLLLNQASVDNVLALRDAGTVNTLDSAYFAGKDSRYTGYNQDKKNIATYHQQHCMPEAGNGYPGPLYEQLHAVCIEAQKKLKEDAGRLDTQESAYKNTWQLKRKALVNLKHNDFFSKADLLPGIITNHPSMKWLVGAMALVLVYIELQALIMKLSVKRDDEYHKNLEVYQEGKKANTQQELEGMIAMDKGDKELAAKKAAVERKDREFRLKMEQLHRGAKQEYEVSESKAIFAGKNYVESAAAADLILNEFVRTHRPNPLISTESIFHMTQAMKLEVSGALAGVPATEAHRVLYELVTAKITYDDQHSRKFYRSAAEVYNNGTGVCGEQAVLLMAYYRYADIECRFVLVKKNEDDQPVMHACVALRDAEGNTVLADPGQQQYPANHQDFELLSDGQLLDKYKKWNV